MLSPFNPLRTNLSWSAATLATVLVFGCLGLGCQVPGAADLVLPPGAPPTAFALVPGQTSFGVLWPTVQGADQYLLEASALPPSMPQKVQKTVAGPSAQLVNLVAGDHLSLRIRAENASGASDWSTSREVTYVGEPRRWHLEHSFDTQTVDIVVVSPDLTVTFITTLHHIWSATCVAGSGWVSWEWSRTDETGNGGPSSQVVTGSGPRFGTWVDTAEGGTVTLTSELVNGGLRLLEAPVVLTATVVAEGTLDLEGQTVPLTGF